MMDTVRKVSLSDIEYRSLYPHAAALSRLIRQRFGCVIGLQGPAILVTSQWANPAAAAVLYEKKCGNVVISVWKDDMTRQDADAVVNAANERLDHAGGLAFALLSAGGYRVDQESRAHVSTYGPVSTGCVVATSGGNLPCKSIIHAVGPEWRSWNKTKCETQLEDTIKAVLQHVNKDPSIRSVSIPAVSSGIFSFPLDKCADIIVKITQSFCLNVKCDHLREIRLVNNDDKTVSAMRRACEKVLGPSDRPGGASARTSTYQGLPATGQGPSSSHQWAPSPFQEPPNHKGTPSVTINAVTLTLLTGCIEDQNTDVIVNSIAGNLILEGEISRAILWKAGYEIQDELSAFKYGSTGSEYRSTGSEYRSTGSEYRSTGSEYRSTGSVLSTRGYKLPSRFVYHTILAQYREQHSEEVMKEVVYTCLKMVTRNGYQSISFPALGTGINRYPKNKVAEILLNTITSFSWDDTNPLDVRIVIHPNDKETRAVFEKQFKQLQAMSGPSPSRTASERESRSTEEEKCLVINASREEEVTEVEIWLRETLLDLENVRIQNNNLLLFGKKEHEMLGKMTGVLLTEHLQDGTAGLRISGPPGEVMGAALQVEQALLEVQEEQATKMEAELVQSAVQWFYKDANQPQPYPVEANAHIEKAYLSNERRTELINPSHQVDLEKMTAFSSAQFYYLQRQSNFKGEFMKDALRGTSLGGTSDVDPLSQEFKDKRNEFEKVDLTILRIQKIRNELLGRIYQSRKDAAETRGSQRHFHKLYQRVPGQYYKLVSRVGFNRLHSAGGDSGLGAGIYFKKNLRDIKKEESDSREPERLLYIFQAEVVTGSFTVGNPSYILPPPRTSPYLYDSVVDSVSDPKTFVIFDGCCALPQYVFTCKWRQHRGSR
uniref:Poly(ADP-ribose) polymerase family member 9 n=1 Tax=Leptobrachium leishanense TaxID=445787 RepID=A0A8C5PZI6_9ANUR